MTTSERTGLSVYEKVAKLTKLGLSVREVAEGYDAWAHDGKYDKDLTPDVYTSPSITAAAVAQHLQGRPDVRILDLGAGTGLVAIQLREFGFTQIDAMDASEGMLEVARERNLYQQIFCGFFEGKVDMIKTSSYDVLVCCGSMGRGLIQWDMMGEMVRCVKTGGLVVLLFRERILRDIEGFKDHFEPYVKQLEVEGQWVLLERTLVPGYVNDTGVKFVFKVTKKDQL